MSRPGMARAVAEAPAIGGSMKNTTQMADSLQAICAAVGQLAEDTGRCPADVCEQVLAIIRVRQARHELVEHATVTVDGYEKR
jgi:hypothetical protein